MIICVVGPTGVGKTKLSIALAKYYNGEVVNGDSVQVYKGLDIGSAKVREEEKEGIKHHLLDIVDVLDNYTIYNYQKDCRRVLDDILKRKKVPIIVGGSGLYIKAALYDYKLNEEETKDNLYEDLSNKEILEKIDSYNKNITVDRNNRRRLVRLLNKLEKGVYEDIDSVNLIYDKVIFIGLKADSKILYEHINKRFLEMLPGLIDEMWPFYRDKIESKALQTAIGYKELYPFFRGEETLTSCVEKIMKNTRNYAKRQYTFFKHQLPVVWFDVNYDNFQETIDQVITYVNKIDN